MESQMQYTAWLRLEVKRNILTRDTLMQLLELPDILSKMLLIKCLWICCEGFLTPTQPACGQRDALLCRYHDIIPRSRFEGPRFRNGPELCKDSSGEQIRTSGAT